MNKKTFIEIVAGLLRFWAICLAIAGITGDYSLVLSWPHYIAALLLWGAIELARFGRY